MMKKSLLCFVLLLSIVLHGTAADSRWTLHNSFHNATACYAVDDVVYAVCNGSLMSYHPTDTEVRLFTKAGGMSDTQIAHSAWCAAQKCLVLVYDNYNIDLVYADGRKVNMPQYKNNSNVRDKKINDLTVQGSMAYLSTVSGILEVNLERLEFGKLYSVGAEVYTCAQLNGYLIASTADGLYRGDLKQNLLNPSSWQNLGPGYFVRMNTLGNAIYALGGDGIYKLNSEGNYSYALQESMKNIQFQADKYLVAWNAGRVYLITPDGKQTRIDHANDFCWVTVSGSTLWTCRGYNGLQPYKLTGTALQAEGEPIIPNSPIRNYCYYLDHTSQGRLLIAGGSLNYTGQFFPGTLMSYEENTWYNFPEEGIAQQTGVDYCNLTSLVQDPEDPTHFFASSARQGLYEFKQGAFTAHYHCDNSPLMYIKGHYAERFNYVSTDGLTYDAQGNLWMINNEVDTILRCKRKDGTWKGYYFSALAGLPTCEKLLIDSRSYLWITSKRSTNQGHKSGVFVFDREGNRHRFRSSFSNQDGVAYIPSNVYALAEDMDGQFWVGTDLGPFVIDDPESFIDNASYAYHQIKIPRNDGTDLADYLLTGTAVTAIAVDGGNRKWLGTGSGVYVVSPDGQETVHHFTTDNAPLPSNNIQSISIHPLTGEVFISTEKGLASYRSDVVPAADKLSDDNLHIYPNPVRPGYEGNIVINGLTFNSDVKIATAGGQVVAGGTSVGGTFTWDGRDPRGNRVASGVYFVLAATEKGKKGAVGRIVVIK